MERDITQVDRVKARLDPRLNEPYFHVEDEVTRMSKGGCTHYEHGARLVTPERRVFCRNCGAEIDAFDALLGYAKAERRLVHTAIQIREHEASEQRKKERELERRPHGQVVTARVAIVAKAPPHETIGYTLTLACGHKQRQDHTRHVHRPTCLTCVENARKNKP